MKSGFTDSCGQEINIYITHLLERIYYFETRQSFALVISLSGWLKDSKSSSTRSFQIPKFETRSFLKIGFDPSFSAETGAREGWGQARTGAGTHSWP